MHISSTATEKVASNEDCNIWSSILQQVQTIGTKKLASNKSILILGDSESGKTSLIAKMAGVDSPMRGSGLEYDFLEIRDEYRDETTKLGCWTLDGDKYHVNLLKFALKEDNLHNTHCLLVASMSEPWNIISSLEGWANVLENHIRSISPQGSIEKTFVITKTDFMVNLEKDYDYNEETFDFIQQAIRKLCLRLGASLFYVSAKINKNCDLLYKFLAHRIYDLPFSTPALVIERDAIFVPSGWDNERKISILYENIRNANPDDDYNDFIVKRVNPKPVHSETEVIAEEDQTFLARMQALLNAQQSKSPRDTSLRATPSPVQSRTVDARRSLANNSQMSDSSPTGEGVLQTFFNSLLARGRAQPPDGSSQ